MKQEIEILKAVGNHPHVVQLLDHWEDASKHYLVTELCSGGDLFSQIVEHGKYSESEAIRCCTQLAQALKHIHACGITHRDLKPSVFRGRGPGRAPRTWTRMWARGRK